MDPILGTPYSDWDPDIIYWQGKFYCYFAPFDDRIHKLASSTTASNPPVDGWVTPVVDASWAPGVYGYDYDAWDWFPVLWADESGLYIFYTSERNRAGTAKGPGNIWVYHHNKPRNWEKVGKESITYEEFYIPEKYNLTQNYPNPFNPETNIRFQLPEAGYVTISVYNTIGQEIRTLVENQYEAGFHNVHWNGKDQYSNDVSSGLYFYKIQAGNFSAMKKMCLVR